MQDLVLVKISPENKTTMQSNVKIGVDIEKWWWGKSSKYPRSKIVHKSIKVLKWLSIKFILKNLTQI